MAEWRIIFYTTDAGASPVTDFIDDLDEKAQAKVINTAHSLREYGVRLGGSHTKKLTGTELWEPRILGSDSIRIFYIAIEQQNFLFLHGLKKKSFKTPARELRVASDRLRDYRARI
jgi:phage-related protein